MKCPFCASLRNKVIDSRLSKDGVAIRRRRECLECRRRFTTYERVEEVDLLVVKKDGRREPFDRNKIITGMLKACEKRPISVKVIEDFVSEFERELQERGEREVESREIGERVIKKLYELDEVAYVRFASVYRSFKDINQFMEELKDLLREKEKESSKLTEKAEGGYSSRLPLELIKSEGEE
jgi:transcriptional repressor NrdR